MAHDIPFHEKRPIDCYLFPLRNTPSFITKKNLTALMKINMKA